MPAVAASAIAPQTTLLPAQSEILLSAMAISGRYDLLLLLLSATAGNTRQKA
jgi:membrane protein YqaA with SNARE-associated domain